MKRKKKNAGFSYHPALVPHRTQVSARRQKRKASHLSSPLMGPRMSQAERLKQEKLLREIAKLGRRERNTMAKKKKGRKRRQPAALRRYWAEKRRKKKNARRRKPVARRRNLPKHIHLNLTLSPKNKRVLARFLSRATGRRVKVK